MEVHVFSNSKRSAEWFGAIKRSKKHALELHEFGELKAWTRQYAGSALIYVDIQGLDEKEVAKLMRYLSALGPISQKPNGNLLFGILDPKGALKDSAELFHVGAIDYVGKQLFASGFDTKRLDRAAGFAQSVLTKSVSSNGNGVNHAELSEVDTGEPPKQSVGGIDFPHAVGMFDIRSVPAADSASYRYSESDWSAIEPDTEYTFWFAFVSLNASRELAGQQSTEQSARLVAAFQQALDRYFAPVGGKIWMWKDFSGLVLFPFDGTTWKPVLAAYRFILNQNLVNAEDLGLSVPISFQIALDIGNTTYREAGKTGTIISDSVNYIFHLGQKFAPQGALTITSQIIPFLPERMTPLIIPMGKFEGRLVYRLRVPTPA